MRAIGQTDAGAGPRDLLDRDRVGQIAHAGAAVFLGDGDAQKAEVAHLAPQVGGEDVLAVHLRGDGLDPFLRPAVNHVAQGVHVLAQVEIHPSREHHNPPPVIERSFS